MANEDSTINRLEECCKSDDSAKFAEVLEPASKEILHEVYENDKNDLGWPTVGAYLLCAAVQVGAIQCLRIILGYVSANVKAKDGRTPLHEAALLDDPNVAKVLLEHGARVNATTDTGYSSIHFAASRGKVQTLSLLCSVVDADLNLKTGYGRTPLHIAVLNHHTESVITLLHFGVRTDIGNLRNKTPRDFAVQCGYQDIVDLIDKAAATPPEEPASTKPTAAATAAAPSTPKPKESAAAAVRRVLPSPVLISHERKVNGWSSAEYRENYAKLVERMHPNYFKRHCFSLEILSMDDMDDINAKATRTEKNEAILRVLSVSGEKFGVFRELLHFSNDCRNIAEQLDAVGPDRTTDERCLYAKAILHRK